MKLPIITKPDDFPPIEMAMLEPNGLLAYGFDLSDDILLSAYYRGIFPWFNPGEPVLWWSPNPRAAFFPDQFKPSRSLLKTLRQKTFKVTVNNHFQGVIKRCAEPNFNRPATWITEQMIEAYSHLHRSGWAHSIEVWQDDELVGGLYGINIGHLFFGESMFHRVTNGSKIALLFLIQMCKQARFPLIDCQLPNPHLMRLGAKEVSREDFLGYLNKYRDLPKVESLWLPRELVLND